jgi:hypothetical protein
MVPKCHAQITARQLAGAKITAIAVGTLTRFAADLPLTILFYIRSLATADERHAHIGLALAKARVSLEGRGRG